MPLFAEVRVSYAEAVSLESNLRPQCLADLKQGRQTNIPIYSFAEHQRLDETKYLYGAAVIISGFYETQCHKR